MLSQAAADNCLHDPGRLRRRFGGQFDDEQLVTFGGNGRGLLTLDQLADDHLCIGALDGILSER